MSVVDIKTRELAIKLVNKGFTQKLVAEMLSVSDKSISSWFALLRETGSLEKRPYVRNTEPKINKEKLLNMIEEEPRQTQGDLAHKLNCSQNTVSKFMKKNGITKKKFHIQKKNQMK